MSEKGKMDIYRYMNNVLIPIFSDGMERDNVVYSIFDEVIADINECADEEFNYSDIDSALSRVIYNRIINN